MTAEIQKREDAIIDGVIPAGAIDGVLDYDSLASSPEIYAIPGFSLAQKEDLLGVPHIVVGVTFQQPTKDKANPYGERDFVTLRAVIGSESALAEAVERGWIPGKLAFKPNELICYNDGSTGVRRDIVRILAKAGMVKLPDPSKLLKDVKDVADVPWSQWLEFSQTGMQGEHVVPEWVNNHNGNQFLLKVPRGLRASDYSNEYVESARTYYL